ncbi:peptidase C65 Otubain-domain-containing protein [Mycotypha africana]|uniref:peptidase C65 Otubain-domain-containing protein n=1 Tax=Mycotypha africana TaxID=64632 RepID=UPI002300F692|nr:peptidase C65 Otubain-domain-containing protein [Mycotypha africana]KAI8971752.1 peptidase C65 Otubain-domain-containing protein [Mycotypha africana]
MPEGNDLSNADNAFELTDEQILRFEQDIKDEEAQKMPLVLQISDISTLTEEYQSNERFIKKIQNLRNSHDKIRRCRGDGNCFFRAFSFAWFESAMYDQRLFDARHKFLKESIDFLQNGGFDKMAFEDFYEVTLETFENMNQHDPDMLLVSFQTDEVSNAIVVFFRFITSAYLRIHAAEYEPFLTDELVSIDQFCAMHVEAFGRESDHLQIIALSKATDVPVEVAYLDGGESDEVALHGFWPTEQDEKEKLKQPIDLLYRPGHYDILYCKKQ